MATTFEFKVRHENAGYAAQALQAAFQQVDRLERLLSRFVEGSDIWRINTAEAGAIVPISEECHACLALAFDLHERTGGAFDVTVGSAMDRIREKRGALLSSEEVENALERRVAVTLDAQHLRIAVSAPGAGLDLGAIGKGFALDRSREFLREWGIENGLLSAGGSSVLAFGRGSATENGWPARLRGDGPPMRFDLVDAALGASGLGEQGRHIVDPRHGGQTYRHSRVWAKACSAAVADALSTAWMTMTKEEIAAALARMGPGHTAILEDAAGALHTLEAEAGRATA